jgi:hypothetical protein
MNRIAVLSRLQKMRRSRRIPVVCEGEKTKPNYFRKFPADTEAYNSINVFETGYNMVSMKLTN